MTEAELKTAFEARQPALHALGLWVTETIQLALASKLGPEVAVAKFLQIPPLPRVKATDSFLEKALVRKPTADPIADITDQVGVRFVVLMLEQIDFVGGIVEAGPWDAQKDRDFQAERRARPDYFAYQSDHYVVRTRSDTTVNGVRLSAGMSCEIQIRTILQHAYAEMAHASSYKPTLRLPDEDQRLVNRALAKGSALIETTDDVFDDIRSKLREYNESTGALLASAREIYRTITNEEALPTSIVGEMIADAYRNLLTGVTPERLKSWARERPWLGEQIRRRRLESVFYRDAVVIIIGFLVTEHQTAIPGDWPVDSSYLEELYGLMGISTVGLF